MDVKWSNWKLKEFQKNVFLWKSIWFIANCFYQNILHSSICSIWNYNYFFLRIPIQILVFYKILVPEIHRYKDWYYANFDFYRYLPPSVLTVSQCVSLVDVRTRSIHQCIFLKNNKTLLWRRLLSRSLLRQNKTEYD